jgi:RNA polymerase sigma-70 factor, ECF subfamily
MMGETATREERFNRLYGEHVEAVRRYVWRRDPSLRDDVLAETFMVAWRRLDEIPDNARPWLIGVARNVRLNLRRARRRQDALSERLAADSVRPDEEVVSLPGDIGAALEALSETDREVLLLSCWDDLDRRSVAQVLGCSERTVSVRLHRARKRFAAAYESATGAARPTLIPGGASDAC